MQKEAGSGEGGIKGKVDLYNGIIIDPATLPSDLLVFGEALQGSLDKWKKEGRRGIWLQIPTKLAHLISVALELGFVLHHADVGYVMLTHWLAPTPSTLPQFATHFVAVGGFVLNHKNEVLVVKEKSGPITGIWKFPGGMSELNEEIWQCAIREVKEETGIDTEFVSLLYFRQFIGGSFGRSDLYFLCQLRPLNQEIKKQDSEIAECKWMPLAEFASLPYYTGAYKNMIELAQKAAKGEYQGLVAQALPSTFRNSRDSTLYYHSQTTQQGSPPNQQSGGHPHPPQTAKL
jgi:ADP-ribose pyrophosphatase YjhB (NUDIX family)